MLPISMQGFLKCPKSLVRASSIFMALGVVISLIGLNQESENLGAVGLAMFFPAMLGYFRVLHLTCR